MEIGRSVATVSYPPYLPYPRIPSSYTPLLCDLCYLCASALKGISPKAKAFLYDVAPPRPPVQTGSQSATRSSTFAVASATTVSAAP